MQFSPRQQEVTIGGVPVQFPFKPYPSQVAMMAKVIQALNQGTNALLESPTGSGKSLALLCSSLAWLSQQKERKTECRCTCHSRTVPIPCQNGMKIEDSTLTQNGIKPFSEVSETHNPALQKSLPDGDGKGGVAKIKERGVAPTNDDVIDVDSDFRRPKKRYRTPGGVVSSENKKICVKIEKEEGGGGGGGGEVASWTMEVGAGIAASQQPSVMDTGIPSSPSPNSSPHPPHPPHPPATLPLPCDVCQCDKGGGGGGGGGKSSSASAIPKVYFGTRTHHQISQITHELAKTAYTSTPMCVMGSREHACIHPEVSRSKRKNDECKKVLEDGMCTYYYRVAKKMGSQAQLLQHGLSSAWDMEDLVGLGKRVKACPYFAIRGIKEEAQIVFCPYNYLIDPLIRDQMLIELEGQVVVFDEAHNMEDAAREAASISLSSFQLEEMVKEFTDILETYTGKLRSSFQYLAGITVTVKKWMEDTVSSQPDRNGFDQICGIWAGQDFIPVLHRIGIIDNCPEMIRSNLKAITEAVNEQKRNEEQGEQSEYIPSPSTATMAVLKGLAMVLSYLFRLGQSFADDYRISLMRTSANKVKDDGWRRRKRSRMMEKVWMYTLNFWCLNPSVAFSELSCAHSVILTSGTLSPLSSFSSELGMEFKVRLEATHVVPEAQTFIRSISCGPNNRALCATYQNSETYEFQDEVGGVINQVCQAVPDGVLCFFSSYKMLHKLTQRWQMTGIWRCIEKKKMIITEPNGSNKAEFEVAMRQFYTAVREAREEGGGGGGGEERMSGALFLAVCRGKVSEGLDFSDHNARAVITVGIPFPSIKDKQVELKREYNNQYCRSRGLLTGSEWYDIQAFRAINQALGRCIRHRDDWGALVLVDDRFSKGLRYTRGLSKWIRRRLIHEMSFSVAMKDLTTFSHRMTSSSSNKCCDTSCSSLSISKLLPTPLSPYLSSPHPHPHHHLLSSTPLSPALNGRIKWQPPYSNTNTPSTTTNDSLSSPTLTSVISQLRRSFRYPPTSATPTATPTAHHQLQQEVLKGNEMNDSIIEITHVESETTVLLVDSSPPPSPPPPPDPPTQSPLLFTDSSTTPTAAPPKTPSPSLPPPPPPPPPPAGCSPSTTSAQDAAAMRDRVVDETTPPLSPQQPIQPITIEDVVGVVKAATPLRKTRANTRLARRRQGVNNDSVISGCGQNRMKPTMTDVEGKEKIICSTCQTAISSSSSSSSSERCRLEDMIGEKVKTSRLWRELDSTGDVLLLSPSPPSLLLLHCQQREETQCNAVWDEEIGMCFGILECCNGHMVGVRVHSARSSGVSLVDKVILGVSRTTTVGGGSGLNCGGSGLNSSQKQ